MNTLFVAARAVHYASAMLLFGELVFVIAVARPAWRRVQSGDGDAVYRRLLAVARWSVIASIVSGVAWLAAQAAVMSGVQVGQAMNRETLGLVLGNTVFGHVWVLRFGLDHCARRRACGAAAIGRRSAQIAPGDRRRRRCCRVPRLARLGRARGRRSRARRFRPDRCRCRALARRGRVAGRAAGACVFASLAPMRSTRWRRRRGVISNLGMASVCVLVVSGLTNAWYQVGDVPALIGTDYGRLLLAKLGLFAAMLGLAVTNRGVLTPRLAGGDRAALHLLRRNAVLEIAAGIGVVIIVGVLGVTVPAAHQSPVWPFDYTLSWQPLQQSAWMQVAVAAAGAVACISAAVTVAGLLGRPPRLRFAALAGIAIPAGILRGCLACRRIQRPTQCRRSATPRTRSSSGSALYASHCIACHGPDGGDGRQPRPCFRSSRRVLTERVPSQREGDLFWWIAHGIPNTPMPGFASQLSDVEIWNLIQFLDAQAMARNAHRHDGSRQTFAPCLCARLHVRNASGARRNR